MTEEEISKQMDLLQRQIAQAICKMDDTTPASVLIASLINMVGIVVDASQLHQQTAALLRDCADQLQAQGQAAASATGH